MLIAVFLLILPYLMMSKANVLCNLLMESTLNVDNVHIDNKCVYFHRCFSKFASLFIGNKETSYFIY